MMKSRRGILAPGPGGRQYIGAMPFLRSSVLSALPGRCQVCHAWPAKPVCADCVHLLARPTPRCERCATPVTGHQPLCGACLRAAGALSRCVAAVDYGYPWDRLIARFKFGAEPAWAALFARLMVQAPGARALLRACDGVVPIPLTAARLAERGYNQSWELAKAVCRLGDATALARWPQALVRLGHAPDQHSLSREQRLHNLSGLFTVHPTLAPELSGSRVLLVDDVSTTGATLQAAAEALRQAGASEVNALVLARTPPETTWQA